MILYIKPGEKLLSIKWCFIFCRSATYTNRLCIHILF